MQWRSWSFVDKSNWGPGPWQDEPDKLQWTDAATGLPCLIVRAQHGALCGYVGVAEGNPFFQMEYDNVDAGVHGGLTFSGFCQEDNAHGICHIPDPGEPERVWWEGFDAAHAGDLCPAYPFDVIRSYPQIYRDIEWMKAECTRLASYLVSPVAAVAAEEQDT